MCVCVCVCMLVAQSCPTLCDPMNPPGSSVHGILQARTLEWVAILFFKFTYLLFIVGCSGSLLLCAHRLSLVAVFGDYSPVGGAQLLTARGFSCCRAQAPGQGGFSACGTRAQRLWCMGSATLRHVESSQIRDRTHVPCIGRWIP